jgi:hypothetical protein
MEEGMKFYRTRIAAIGFALLLPIAIGTDVDPAAADGASNSQLRGQYAGTSTGGCLISLAGFDENTNRPKDQTKTYSNLFSTDVVFTFEGNGRGKADFRTVVNMIVPGPNAPPVAQPQVSLSTGGGNFTYSVGPKNTVTVTLKDPEFRNLPALQSGSTIDRVVLEGHFGPFGVTLVKTDGVKTDGAVEIITPFNGSPFPRICERSFVLLSDRPRL